MNDFANHLLKHYKKNARKLPWREDVSPYHIWLSEIMLQQTTVKTVIPYFEKFTVLYPTIDDLALASLEDILQIWQGLGYYSRARNLHKCAQIIHKNGGIFPQQEKELLKLPGIGPYTAAAISSIAFHQKATVVDGNVERVMSRLHRIDTPLPKAKGLLSEKAKNLTPSKENALYSNAIMELGALICTPKKPKCGECPVRKFCTSHGKQDIEDFPKKMPKKAKKTDHGTVYIIRDNNGLYYLQKRPDKGLLAGLWEFPSTGWAGESTDLPNFMEMVQEQAELIGQIRHIFTHIDLTFDVMFAQVNKLEDGFHPSKLPPMPTLMRKVLSKV